MAFPEGPSNGSEIVIPEGLSWEDVCERHAKLLEHLQDPGSNGSTSLLSPENLKGLVLNIGFWKNPGVQALEAVGSNLVCPIYLQEPQLASGQKVNFFQEKRRARLQLMNRLRAMPSNSVNLITLFDYRGDFVSQESIEEMVRMLASDGRCLMTVQDRAYLPNARLPNTGYAWRLMGEEFFPNVAVSVFTK